MRAIALTAVAAAAASLASANLLACSPATVEPPAKPGSRGMRADQHLDAAQAHERRAQELARWPETRPGGSGVVDDRGTGLWYRRWDTTTEEQRMAASHRAAAGHIQAAYDEACGDAPAPDVAVSPIRRHGIGGAPTADGVVVYLEPSAGSPDQILRALRCHRAWMMLADAGMDDCPLDLAGLRIVAHGDPYGVSVELSVPDPRLVPELQRRTNLDLEAGRRGPPPR